MTYRGYVYDHETGLYYLQSRYYNPETGRGWYDKRGTLPGRYVSSSYVNGPCWTTQEIYGPMALVSQTYTSDTIYFAVKEDWDTE